MTLSARIRNVFYEADIQPLDVDGVELIAMHRQILEKKPLLRSAIEAFYLAMSERSDRLLPASGLEVELGSGVGFFKRLRPSVITSDIRSIPAIDRTIDAQKMDLPTASVRCIYAINAFHHFPNPEQFFAELCRVLKPGGGCILIEPHNGLASRLLHRHMIKDQHFDSDARAWAANITGPMSGANQALAHIVFTRDRMLFDQKYGKELEIVEQSYCLNGLRYFFSGGLTFRQLLPAFTEPVLRALEAVGRPLAKHWTFHRMTVLRKR